MKTFDIEDEHSAAVELLTSQFRTPSCFEDCEWLD